MTYIGGLVAYIVGWVILEVLDHSRVVERLPSIGTSLAAVTAEVSKVAWVCPGLPWYLQMTGFPSRK